ncbi:MAG: Rne/Rng family ribonuclease [Phycisphaeraceae bacterium]|nr:MAG: Rne/Rng family ribonuclease [Phycisphaeraceae bacterium]
MGKGTSGANAKTRMVINYVPGEECRIALVENGCLEEFHAERANAVTFVGNIHIGRVVNVEAGIQAAFIDFGHESNGFLHVSDLHPRYFRGEDREDTELIGKKTPRRERPPIQQCLKRGQEVIVQVLKEGISTKGPTLTSYLSIPGRYLVMLPDMDKVGVSRKVEDEEQRAAMKKVLEGVELPEGFGFIVRTAGIDKNKTEIKRDLAYLQRLWKDIERRRSLASGPGLLYAESDLLMRALRDYWTSDVDEIVIDDPGACRRAARFMKIVSPRSSTQLLHYDRATPIFHAFGLEDQIRLMHEREVPLPSGGSLIIDETEALVAIDVNSGKMRRHGDAETTAFKTNLEAVDEISRQLKLRDLGGLILCDLIDMMKRSNRRDVENRFRDRLKKDRAATKVLPISQFGIAEMTRQRMRGSLRSTHYTKCPMCEGKGLLRRPGSAAADALRELAMLLDMQKVHKVELVVSPRLAGELLSNRRQSLTRIEFRAKKKVDVRVSEDVPVDRVIFYAYDENGADLALDRMPMPTPPSDLEAWREQGAGKDWAVDTRTEQDEDFANAIEETAPQASDAEMLLEDMELDEAALDTEDASEQGDGKKKRRRRRRRGKRGGGASEGAAPTESREPAKQEQAPKPDEPRAQDAEADATGEGTGKKKRRRRRRRGKRSGDEAQETSGEAPTSDDARGRPEMIPDRAETDQRPVRTSTGLRGDSWDLEPSELPKRNGRAAPATAAEEPKPAPEASAQDDDTEAPPRPGKKRSRKRARSASKSSEAPDTEKKAPEKQAPEPAAETAPEDAPAPGGKKKRSKRSRSGAAKAKATPEPSSDADKKPKQKPKDEAKPEVALKPVKPARTLYAAQRRKPSPAAIKSAANRES